MSNTLPQTKNKNFPAIAGNRKIDYDVAQQIRKDHKNGMSYREILEKYGFSHDLSSKGNVSAIIQNKIWNNPDIILSKTPLSLANVVPAAPTKSQAESAVSKPTRTPLKRKIRYGGRDFVCSGVIPDKEEISRCGASREGKAEKINLYLKVGNYSTAFSYIRNLTTKTIGHFVQRCQDPDLLDAVFTEAKKDSAPYIASSRYAFINTRLKALSIVGDESLGDIAESVSKQPISRDFLIPFFSRLMKAKDSNDRHTPKYSSYIEIPSAPRAIKKIVLNIKEDDELLKLSLLCLLDAIYVKLSCNIYFEDLSDSRLAGFFRWLNFEVFKNKDFMTGSSRHWSRRGSEKALHGALSKYTGISIHREKRELQFPKPAEIENLKISKMVSSLLKSAIISDSLLGTGGCDCHYLGKQIEAALSDESLIDEETMYESSCSVVDYCSPRHYEMSGRAGASLVASGRLSPRCLDVLLEGEYETVRKISSYKDLAPDMIIKIWERNFVTYGGDIIVINLIAQRNFPKDRSDALRHCLSKKNIHPTLVLTLLTAVSDEALHLVVVTNYFETIDRVHDQKERLELYKKVKEASQDTSQIVKDAVDSQWTETSRKKQQFRFKVKKTIILEIETEVTTEADCEENAEKKLIEFTLADKKSAENRVSTDYFEKIEALQKVYKSGSNNESTVLVKEETSFLPLIP